MTSLLVKLALTTCILDFDLLQYFFSGASTSRKALFFLFKTPNDEIVSLIWSFQRLMPALNARHGSRDFNVAEDLIQLLVHLNIDAIANFHWTEDLTLNFSLQYFQDNIFNIYKHWEGERLVLQQFRSTSEVAVFQLHTEICDYSLCTVCSINIKIENILFKTWKKH